MQKRYKRIVFIWLSRRIMQPLTHKQRSVYMKKILELCVPLPCELYNEDSCFPDQRAGWTPTFPGRLQTTQSTAITARKRDRHTQSHIHTQKLWVIFVADGLLKTWRCLIWIDLSCLITVWEWTETCRLSPLIATLSNKSSEAQCHTKWEWQTLLEKCLTPQLLCKHMLCFRGKKRRNSFWVKKKMTLHSKVSELAALFFCCFAYSFTHEWTHTHKTLITPKNSLSSSSESSTSSLSPSLSPLLSPSLNPPPVSPLKVSSFRIFFSLGGGGVQG